MEIPEHRSRLLGLLKGPSEQTDLAEASLLIACEAYPQLDVDGELARIQDLAEEVSALEGLPLVDAARRMAEVLHDRHGFSGDKDNYDDPQNSFLNRVLDRKKGLPILLSILYVAVARRCGLLAEGLALPGHFALRLRRSGEKSVFLDPFHGGRIVKGRDVLIRELDPSPDSPAAGALRASGTRMILTRLLSNLRRSYASRNALFELRWVLELILLVNTGSLPALGPAFDPASLDGELLSPGSDLDRELEKTSGGRSPNRFESERRLLSRVRAALN